MKARFWVVCPDYVSGPHGSREVAQRVADVIGRLEACHYDHEVIERIVKPVAANNSLAWADDED